MGRRVVLASGSPRRKELLATFIDDFEIHVSECDEAVPKEFTPDEAVLELSKRKAYAVAKALPKSMDDDYLIIGSDTVVSVDGNILGKPADRSDAVHMINMISGREHKVFSGVAVYHCNASEIRLISNFYEETGVFVHLMTDKEISDYVDTGEGYDKAGSYAIQGLFSRFIDKINGDYYSVVGLPVAHLYQEIKDYLA